MTARQPSSWASLGHDVCRTGRTTAVGPGSESSSGPTIIYNATVTTNGQTPVQPGGPPVLGDDGRVYFAGMCDSSCGISDVTPTVVSMISEPLDNLGVLQVVTHCT